MKQSTPLDLSLPKQKAGKFPGRISTCSILPIKLISNISHSANEFRLGRGCRKEFAGMLEALPKGGKEAWSQGKQSEVSETETSKPQACHIQRDHGPPGE